MNSRPRIAILGIHLESNAFAPVTTEADFRASCYYEGEAMLEEAAKPAPASALNFIVGNEHVETTAKIEIVRFTF